MACNLRFELRRDAPNKEGKCPINLIIVVEQQRRKLSTGINLIPQLWDAKKQEAVYVSSIQLKKDLVNFDLNELPLKDDIRKINDSLFHLKKNVEREVERFKLNSVPYSAEMLVNAYKEKAIPETRKELNKSLFVNFMTERIPQLTAKRTKGTLQVYNSTLQHFKEFEKYRRTKYEIKDINYSVFESLDAYLLREQHKDDGTIWQMQNATIHKIVKTIKTFLNHAAHIGLETSNNYRKYQIELKRKDPITITFDELNLLIDMKLKPMQEKVRDVFVFACATGLRISDLSQIKWEHINKSLINITALKTNELITIPLNHYSSSILYKYRLSLTPIPRLSEQHLNSELKIICFEAGIITPVEVNTYSGAKRTSRIVEKWTQISMHTARRTFVSLALENGLDAETIRRWTGHKDLRSFSAYVNIQQDRLKTQMEKAFGVPNHKLKAGN